MRFADIPLYPRAHYEIDVELRDLLWHHEKWVRDKGLTMDQDYQRAHVWTHEQKVAYVEHVLRGGEVGKTIIVNVPGWNDGTYTRSEIVDGKQRYTALLGFLRNEFQVFGHFFRDFTDHPRCILGIKWRVVDLTREEILELYLSLNAGGTPHTAEEIERVQRLLAKARTQRES